MTGVHFDPSITLGTLVSILSTVLIALVGYTRFIARFIIIEEKLSNVERRTERIETVADVFEDKVANRFERLTSDVQRLVGRSELHLHGRHDDKP